MITITLHVYCTNQRTCSFATTNQRMSNSGPKLTHNPNSILGLAWDTAGCFSKCPFFHETGNWTHKNNSYHHESVVSLHQLLCSDDPFYPKGRLMCRDWFRHVKGLVNNCWNHNKWAATFYNFRKLVQRLLEQCTLV